MSTLDLILLSVALAMDCFTVSITCGLIQRRLVPLTMFITAFMSGLFQGVMPLIGWAGMSLLAETIERWDHWIAFGLLSFLGIRMIISGMKPKEGESAFDPTRFSTTLTMAVATSIDALAVGLSFGCSGYTSLSSLFIPVTIIALGSFLFSIAGFVIGAYAGKHIRIPAETIGGVILIGIGLKILIEHLSS